MNVCPKCGKEITNTTGSFCKYCGASLTQMNFSGYEGNMQPQPLPPEPAKKSPKKIICAAIAILLVVALVAGGFFFWDWKKKQEEQKERDAEELLMEVLQESTTKPVIEMVCRDYDSNGSYEAYAVVGETKDDKEDVEHHEFYNADIYFVNEKEAQPIKENVSGKTNGTIEVDDTIYISIEVYEEGSDEGYSYIYTVDEDDSVEHEKSGEYSDVHQEDDKIIAKDDTGEEIEIDLLVEPETEESSMTKAETTETPVDKTTEGERTTEEKPTGIERTTKKKNNVNKTEVDRTSRPDNTTKKPAMTKPATTKTTTTKPKTTKPTTTKPSSSNGYSKGDVITFGSYEQDNNTSNGKESIQWIVLESRDNKVLVISKNALDCLPYNNDFASTTWSASSVRRWLNNDFVNSAFSSSEKSKIPTVTVSAEKNPTYSTSAGSNTSDKVFLLSISEAKKYFSSNSARTCKASAYATKKGTQVNGSGNCNWWLRSPGYVDDLAAVVLTDGSVDDYGNFASNSYYAVRPAMWINI